MLIHDWISLGNQKSLENTLDLIKKIPYGRIRIVYATPFKGTKLYQEALEKSSLLTENPDQFTTEEPIIKTNVDLNYLQQFRQKIYREAYLNPNYISRCL